MNNRKRIMKLKMYLRFLSVLTASESGAQSWRVGYVPRKTMNGLSEMSCSDHGGGRFLSCGMK